MPISPAEAKRLHEERTTPPPALFEQIDEALAEGRRNFAVPQVIASKYVDGVVRAYQRVGWKVDYVSDQRDGDFLTFGA